MQERTDNDGSAPRMEENPTMGNPTMGETPTMGDPIMGEPTMGDAPQEGEHESLGQRLEHLLHRHHAK